MEETKTWYESMWDWLGNTATSVYNTKIQGDVAKAEAEALAKAQIEAQNDKLSFLGMELSKTTLLWVAGGTILVTFLLVFVRRK